VHDQYYQCCSGYRHFDNGEGMDVMLNQSVHQDIKFDRALTQQHNRQEGVCKTEQGDGQGCRKRPVAVPVDIPVNMIIIAAMATPSLMTNCTYHGSGRCLAPLRLALLYGPGICLFGIRFHFNLIHYQSTFWRIMSKYCAKAGYIVENNLFENYAYN
jgi:hypothetical protein